MSTRTKDATVEVLEDRRAVLVAILLVASATAGLGLATATPSTEIPVGIAASSGVSMTPTYDSGTKLALYADVGEVEAGDVVVFHETKTTGAYTMHRVVGETERGYVTQGDALTTTDQDMGRSYVTDETRVGEVLVVVDQKGVHIPALA